VHVSLSVRVGILRVGLVHGSGRPRRLWVVRLLSVRIPLIAAVVDVVVVRNVSVLGISASTARDGGCRCRQVNLASRVIIVPIIVYVWHRRVILRVTGCLMVGVWLIIRRHNRVVDDATLLVVVIAVEAGGAAVFDRRHIVKVVIHR